MKLYFLNPESRAAINVTKLKKCGYETRRIIADWVESLAGLVVLANGTPDDQVLGVLCHHLDGDGAVGVVKPTEKTHLSVLYELKTYLNLKISKIVFLADQEELSIDDLFARAENVIRETGINFEVREELDRARTYQCCLASKEFGIAVVLSGLSEVCTNKHTIEDHLAKAAGIEVTGNSKDSWNRLSDEEREDVFRKLKGAGSQIQQLFPQQVYGLRFLRDEDE